MTEKEKIKFLSMVVRLTVAPTMIAVGCVAVWGQNGVLLGAGISLALIGHAMSELGK